MTRTPLRTVPIQKKTKKLASEEALLKNINSIKLGAGLSEINTKSFPSPSFVKIKDEGTEVNTPVSSTTTLKDELDRRCSVWEWRATQIGFFHRKRRYLNLKKRLDNLGSIKEIYPIDNEIFLKPTFKGKKNKYNPREECFFTDISHRSKRVSLFRKRRHTKISGPVSDEMLNHVQVPVDSSSADAPVRYFHDLSSFITEKTPYFDSSDDPVEVKDDTIVNINCPLYDGPTALLDKVDKSAWMKINKDFWNLKDVTRDENNKEIVEPPFVRLKKNYFALILSLLEIETYKEIHNTLLSVLNVPNQAEGEHAFCEICQSATSESDDPIVFCEGCDLSVHQHCFGIPQVPEGAWYCRVCEEYETKTEVNCRFCPLTGGTMKRTHDEEWAHFACAVWQQSLRFDDLTTYESISHESSLKSESFQKICSVCDIAYGSCIKCSVRNCGIPFHPTCGLRGGLLMFVEDNNNAKNGYKMFSFCFYHSNKAKEVQNSTSGNIGIDFILEKLDNDGSNANIASYKMSQLCKLEEHFDKFVNWRTLATKLNINKDLMLIIYEYWVRKRRENSNRPFINALEANEFFIKDKFKPNITPKKPRKQKEAANITDDARVKAFADAHMKLDRCRNLCTLSMRREKLKWQKVVGLKQAFEQVLGNLGDETTHFSSRSVEKLAQYWYEYMELEQPISQDQPSSSSSRSPSKSPKKSKVCTNNVQSLFSDLFAIFPSLPPSLFDELPSDVC